jgi:L-tyrosine isonitrile synthase
MLHDKKSGVAYATPTAHFHNSILAIPPVAAKPRRKKPAAGRAAAHKTVTPEQILQSFNTWAFKREQPTNANLMRPFIAAAIAEGRPISFVLYWGKGPRRRVAEPDLQCLDYVSELAARVASTYHHGAAITLIFTDTHARLNGHCADSIRDYFDAVDAVARERGFTTCRLSDLTRAVEDMPLEETAEAPVSDEVLQRLAACAAKWYRGNGSAEDGATKYYEMNMIEKRAVELAFPGSFFVTFNGSEFSALFPDRLPVFHMYSLRRGISIKPWFVPAVQEAALCKLAS